MTINIAIVGMGKIARDQHIPAIGENPDLRLVATASPNGPGLDGIPHFRSLASLIAATPDLNAVALCTTPQVRFDLAVEAIAHGLHVFLEKPPGATLSEIEALVGEAEAKAVTLFASWHSRFAAGVAAAKAWLSGRTIRKVSIIWREDVRVWHPAQQWIWEPSGLGVFDPGINALSIATEILPCSIFLRDAVLELPSNRSAPIAARLAFSSVSGFEVDADFDWRQTGPQTWDIIVSTDAGTCTLSKGGAVLTLPGKAPISGDDREYRGLYERFASLVNGGRSDVDIAPFRHVADAFLRGHRTAVEPFFD